MIHYSLRCADGHEFDGWFKGSAGFDAQAAAGLVSCPACGGTKVARALMAPKLSRGAAAPAEVATTPTAPEPAPPSPPGMPDQVRAVLARMRAEIEKKCAYVGPDFAAEARRIHDGDAKPRPIYGEATDEQAERLAEDGIEVARIPWVPRADG